jgi:predicted O-methyltransferase YrrM
MRRQARRLAFGISTLLGIRKRGFFIPYRYADQISADATQRPYNALRPYFRAAEPAFTESLAAMDRHSAALRAICGEPPPAPRWNQDWFPRLDAAAAYVLVRETRPARIVEVGSGHSTRFLARAVRDGGLSTKITAIDPAPRADIEGTRATILRMPAQDAGTAMFSELASGDMLFIDSSHILMPGTDVDFLLNHVVPALPAGVRLHIHDIFLPDPYPRSWEWRGYNEQLGVAALIQGGGFRILWSSHYAATRMASAVAASAAGSLELKPGAHEASLWLMKT